MTETIGKITLDLTRYPGQDFYCDGPVEDEILEIVKKYAAVEYGSVIEERKSWPVLYHLSPQRENIVDFIPMKKTDKVLEVGSGCGAVTGAFARKAGSVTCVDLSKKRSMINAYRHSECDNVTIHVGNFQDIEPDLPCDYDYISLIGVFEYGQSYIGGENPFVDYLNILKRHLAPGGRIIIAIENKYGLKYFAGCKEDHLSKYFCGIEDYAAGGGVRTFSRKGLEKIFRTCELEKYSFYYPYPDYKFMTTVYSDERLPQVGELSNNLRNFDQDRMVLFDEKSTFDGLIKDGMFPDFSNSFLVVLGEELPVKYAKFSNDRAGQYQIRTEILREEDGQWQVRKYPLTKSAEDHVRGMELAYRSLAERYRGSDLKVNRCELTEEGDTVYAGFPFEKGVTLAELMDRCLEKEDEEGFYRLFEEYIRRVGHKEEFPAADFDLIFANILADGDQWTLIDYEWTFGKAIETKELAFRAVYCYLLEDERRNRLQLDRILDRLKISQKDAETYREQEMEFQKFVTGNRLSMAQIRDLVGGKLMVPQKWIDKFQSSESKMRVQVYEDTGAGYREEQSRFVADAYQSEQLVEFTYEFDGNVKMLRIDPAFGSCMCRILEMHLNGENVPLQKRKVLITNGKVVKGTDGETGQYTPGIVFPTEDPNININISELGPKAENSLYVKMEVVAVPLQIAQDMAAAVKKLI